MRYSDAVDAAPPGSSTFSAEDLKRLQPSTLVRLLGSGPASPPLEDFALALGSPPELLGCLDPERARELRHLAARPAPEEERQAAGSRLVRALFWYLVYELAPDRWDALAEAEPIHPQLVRALPADSARVVDVAAGSGRLSVPLAARAGLLLAAEPSPPLRRLLARRLPESAWVVAAYADRLPVRDGWADLVTCCASITPEPPIGGDAVLAELERCCRPGGTVALVSPERPEWFLGRGYERLDFGPYPTPACDAELEQFFGRRSPPHELLRKRV